MKICFRLFLVLMLGSGARLWACDCEPLAPAAAYDSATHIFVGTCIQVNSNWISGGMKYSFEVKEGWKKPTDRFYIVNTPFEKDCGVAFELGQEYLVYVRRIFTPKTSLCQGSKLLVEAEADLAFLGNSKPPQASPLTVPMYWTLGGLGLFSIALLAFIVLRKNKN